MSDTLTQVYEVYIRTTPEKLWQALTHSDFTRRFFFGTTVESQWHAGAPLVYRFVDGSVPFDATIEAIEPHRRLVHSFKAIPSEWKAYSDDPPSRVTYEIEQLGPSCLLRVTHEHFAGLSATAERTSHGWPLALSGLKTLLETGESLIVDVREEERV